MMRAAAFVLIVAACGAPTPSAPDASPADAGEDCPAPSQCYFIERTWTGRGCDDRGCFACSSVYGCCAEKTCAALATAKEQAACSEKPIEMRVSCRSVGGHVESSECVGADVCRDPFRLSVCTCLGTDRIPCECSEK